MTASSAIVLAGGEGTRLRALRKALSGADRPKKRLLTVSGHPTAGAGDVGVGMIDLPRGVWR